MEGENAYGRRDLGNTSKYRVFFADCFLVPKQQLYLVRTESTGYTTVVLIGKNMVGSDYHTRRRTISVDRMESYS